MAAFLKFVMFSFNFIFWVAGGTVLGVSIWLAVDSSASDYLTIASSAGMNDSVWAAAVYTTIAVSSLLFLIGFLGCWGSLGNGRPAALMAYSVLVITIIITEIVVVILLIVFYTEINDSVKKGMQNDIKYKYSRPEEKTLTNVWDKMQQEYECCGSYNFSDYQYSYFANTSLNGTSQRTIVPISCCSDDKFYGLCLIEAGTKLTVVSSPSPVKSNLYTKGCYNEMKDFLAKNAGLLIGITCSFVGLQVIGVLLACCLIRKGKRG